MVAVEGRLQTRQWEDERKVRHWKTEIVAAHVEMLSGRRKKDSRPIGGLGTGHAGGHGWALSRSRPASVPMTTRTSRDDDLEEDEEESELEAVAA